MSRHPHEPLRHLDHRPWPLPDKPWAWRQSWLELAFIHYRVAAQSATFLAAYTSSPIRQRARVVNATLDIFVDRAVLLKQ